MEGEGEGTRALWVRGRGGDQGTLGEGGGLMYSGGGGEGTRALWVRGEG